MKEKKIITINADKLTDKVNELIARNEKKDVEITAASIKDDICNYTYEIIEGVGVGDTHNVKGSGLADDDLLKAFSKLNVHLAMIDDVFKHSRRKFSNINDLHGDDLTILYTVTGLKLKGSTEDRQVMLIGTKKVSTASDWMEIKSPFILMDKFSSYEYHRQLKSAIDKAILEVELYKDGKCTPIEEPEEAPVSKAQGKLELSEATAGTDEELQKGKV